MGTNLIDLTMGRNVWIVHVDAIGLYWHHMCYNNDPTPFFKRTRRGWRRSF